MANLTQGMSGSEVEKLQKSLIDAGYNVGGTGADGVFGKNTLAAVKQYQKDNGLAVDGIAGKNTLGSLYGSGTQKATGTGNGGAAKAGNADKPAAEAPAEAAPGTTPVTSPGGVTYGDFTYESFEPSDVVQQANLLLQQNNANRPGSWVDPYQSQYMGYLDQYENRDPFSYDFNSDALYQQYKDNYILQGQMAMMDTMGQAAAMTGGYGNSYAQSVGQQAYNQQLNQLNDIMPELYGMAYDRYQQEGQEMLNMYNLYKGLSDQSFDRYQGELDNWYREDARLTDNYNTLYDREHGDWELGYGTAWDEYITGRNEKFTSSENEKSREFTASENEKSRSETQKANAKSDLVNLITGTGYKPTDSELAAAGMSREQANSYAKAYSDSKTQTPATEPTKYTVLDYEEQAKWSKEFSKATSLADVEWIADRMSAAGVDPQVVASWYDNYAKKFKVETPPVAPKATGGGGGGGRMMMTVK